MEIWNSAAWYNYYKSQTLGIPTFDWSFNTSNTNNGCIIILELLGEISFFVHIYLKSKIFQKKIIKKKKKGNTPLDMKGQIQSFDLMDITTRGTRVGSFNEWIILLCICLAIETNTPHTHLTSPWSYLCWKIEL